MKNYLYILVIGSFLTSCGRFKNEDNKQEQKQRIVCISKQYSEIIYALQAQKEIVAVDVSSTYPSEIKELPTIGYHRALSAEAILAMKPTMILEDNNIGPEHVVKQLHDLNIPMKQFGAYQNTIAGTDSLIREMGTYFGKQAIAETLCNTLDADMDLALKNTNTFKTNPKILVIHFGQASNIYLVMTNHSNASKLIEWAGGTMAVDGERSMMQLSPEIVAQSDPDIILLTDFGYDRLGSIEQIAGLPGISTTRAFADSKIYRVEEHDMVYFGPRTGENVLKLQQLIHQDDEAK
ncbi:heme/hemin ABC transporter substrate-binding protein [Bizionia arctica]|uniref:Fe/B12 periplasmic-binding domain-containing protein n=1 Tax=Bizionia arctica TaxID=1495645 RepID=A0A917GHS5_9FLAO|nr:ABC transporter substrate-binding protein [Bizionia arctica]GGG45835.1 hypothetical protein GCM10010976_16750 [Bizionia arctica]